MGRMKDHMIEQKEDEHKLEWIRAYLNNYDADEFTEGWNEAEDAFEEYMDNEYQKFREYQPYIDNWSVEGKTNFQIFSEIMESSNVIIDISNIAKDHVSKNLFVMLYGHIIAAIEAYLSSTFIDTVMSYKKFLRKLVETDDEFAKRKFTIKEIYTKKEELEDDVKNYLKKLIFHDISKVKFMYKNVLNIDFGNVEWLFKAVLLRHDCVHRAGYDKDGNEIDLDKEKIKELITKCINLVKLIEKENTPL